jgi:hypothetical protein
MNLEIVDLKNHENSLEQIARIHFLSYSGDHFTSGFGIDKLIEYKNSSYKLSSEYCNYDKFDPSIIAQRQNKMAKTAKAIWKSSFIQSLV